MELAFGSIPACAGEPPKPTPGANIASVYPRVCGGTRDACSKSEGTCGLSPRVRGNPTLWASQTRRIGSIPACAGEPAIQT